VGFVEQNIGEFHTRRAYSLQTLKLTQVLKRKNPYLFKAKNINDAHDLVKLLLDAHFSSQEETIFGEFLEKLAIYVCEKAFVGRKSIAEGIDLEFKRDNVLYIVAALVHKSRNGCNAPSKGESLSDLVAFGHAQMGHAVECSASD
jgi:hypothetical protein